MAEHLDLAYKRQKTESVYEDLGPRKSNSLDSGCRRVQRFPQAHRSQEDSSHHYEDLETLRSNMAKKNGQIQRKAGEESDKYFTTCQRFPSDSIKYMDMGNSLESTVFESIELPEKRGMSTADKDGAESRMDDFPGNSIYDMVYVKRGAAPSQPFDVTKPNVSAAAFYTLELLVIRPVLACVSELPFRVDCIVNPTNGQLKCKSPASHTLMRAAGLNFEQACMKAVGYTGGFRVTECCSTEPGDLRCSLVINAVCPTKKDGRDRQELRELVYRTLTNCLLKANEHRATSIAVPSLSLECFESNLEFACLFVDAILEFSRQYPESDRYLKVIYFADVFSKDMLKAIEALFSEAFSSNSSGLFLPKRLDLTGSAITDDDKIAMDKTLSACYRVCPGDAFSKSNPAVYDPETGNVKILIYTHDIRAVTTDALLCPENFRATHGGRTAISIHQTFRLSMKICKHDKSRKGGSGKKHNSVITTVVPEEFPPKYVIHEPFPFWDSLDDDPVEFEEALSSSLYRFFEGFKNKKRTKTEITSVAIPVLGINNLRHSPVSRCCHILATVVKEICMDRSKVKSNLKEVHVICQCRDIAQAMDAYLQQVLT